MNFPDWQIVATIACIVLAALVVLRRAARLFAPGSNPSHGCGTGACSTCPSSRSETTSPRGDFVPLESLVKSGHTDDSPSSPR